MSNEHLITGIAHIGIRVRELARSRVFYERLGFEFILGPVGPEPVAMMTHRAGIEINFIINGEDSGATNVLMDVGEKHAGYTHVAMRVADLDAVLEMLSAEGIEITGGPISYPFGARGVFIRDPDRNVIELYEPAGAGAGAAD